MATGRGDMGRGTTTTLTDGRSRGALGHMRALWRIQGELTRTECLDTMHTMDDGGDHLAPETRERVVGRLDHMVGSGRITESEADRMRSASEPSQFEGAVRDIRVRHAGAKLRAAVESGGMSQEEADAHLERLRKGEHPRSLRAHLRTLLPGRR